MNTGIALVSAILMLASMLWADPKTVVGVSPFQGPDSGENSRNQGREIAEYVSSFLGRSGRVTVVERAQQDKLIEEIRWGLSGAVEDSTAAEAGRMTGASLVAVGRFRRDGGKWKLSARLLETATGIVKGSCLAESRDEGEALDSLSVGLLRSLGVNAAVKPGYGLKKGLGYGLLGAGLLSGGAAVWSHLRYLEADQQYTSRFNLDAAGYSRLRDQATFYQNARWYGGAAAAVLLAAGWAVLFSNSAEWEFTSVGPAQLGLTPAWSGLGLVWVARF